MFIILPVKATRIAYGGKSEFWRVVTLEGALFEKSGTMTGGGGKPRGGKMGTSIRASVSGDAVANAEKELSTVVEKLNNLRSKIADEVKHYQDAEKAISPLEIELAKSQQEVTLRCLRAFVSMVCSLFYIVFNKIS